MSVVIWVNEPGWEAAVDVAGGLVAAADEIVLVTVVQDDLEGVTGGAFTGLLGRRQRPPAAMADDLAAAAQDLLDAAAERLGWPATRRVRTGRTEREVVQAAADAHLLIMARDGDRSRPGPHSLGRAGRFIVDHAACPVLLVWPGDGARTTTLSPPPPPR